MWKMLARQPSAASTLTFNHDVPPESLMLGLALLPTAPVLDPLQNTCCVY